MKSDDMRAIAGLRATFITESQARELLGAPSGSRPRMYGYHGESGQIVKLTSLHYLDKYAPEFLWLSGTTVADLVSPA